MQHIIDKLESWSRKQPELKASAVIGSYASGKARPDSDLDLVLITSAPKKYLESTEWLSEFGATSSLELEDWGLVQSWRAVFDDGSEVEFCITTEEWCSNEQINDGTGRVISNGVRIIHDPDQILENLVSMVKITYLP